MPEIHTTARSAAREARKAIKAQRDYAKRLASMASKAREWDEFFAYLEDNPAYSREIHRISARVSQEIAIERNKNGKCISWEDAWERVVPFEAMRALVAKFDKGEQIIRRDVGKTGAYGRWLDILGRKGEYGMWADAQRDYRALKTGSPTPVVQITCEPAPLILTAIEVKRCVEERNAAFKKIEKEFLGDAREKPRTDTFGFMEEVNRQANLGGYAGKPRKPKRNGNSWRKEK